MKPQLLHIFDTMPNDRGLVALAPFPPSEYGGDPATTTLAFFGRSQGQIQISEILIGKTAMDVAESYKGDVLPSHQTHNNALRLPPPPVSIIAAHNSPVHVFALSRTGNLLASASDTGTLIRVFESRSGRLINELRRGLDKAEIYCIAFNPEGNRICVASDKGTVHIFTISVMPDIPDSASNFNLFMGSLSVEESNDIERDIPRGIAVGDGFKYSTKKPNSGMRSGERGALYQSSVNNQMHDSHFSSSISSSASNIPAFSNDISSSSSTSQENIFILQQQHQKKIQPNTSSSSSLHPSTSNKGKSKESMNRHSSLSFFSPLSKYFSSEWSFATFTLPVESRCICAFARSDRNGGGSENVKIAIKSLHGTGSKWSPSEPWGANAIIVLCADGSAFKFSFDPKKGGECTRESYIRYFKGFGSDIKPVIPSDLEEIGGKYIAFSSEV